MTLKNNKAPLLWYFKLCASFRTHWWIQTGVTVRKRPIWVKINDSFSCATFKLDGWPWKTIGHLFYDTLSFVHHFNAIGKFKLQLKSGNAQFGSKSTIFLAVWPRNFTDDPEQGKSEGFESCDRPIVRKRPIWVKIGDVLSRVTLKFDGWPWKTIGHLSVLCCFKLCATFLGHRWIQTGVTVRKRPIWVKFDDFFSRETLQFDVWPWKTTGHLFYATSSFVHHFVAIGDFKLELQSGNAQSGSNSTIFRAVWPWNLTDDLEKQ